MPSTIQILATILFGLALLHTFSVKSFEALARRYPKGSIRENIFHLLGEIEVVFGLWATVFVLGIVVLIGQYEAVQYLEKLNFTEALFVFVIMVVCSTQPILQLAEKILSFVAKILPFPPQVSFYLTTLIVAPLLGSLITEPAAMTLAALIIRERFFDLRPSNKFKYSTLAVLFVNISIGGTLTHFAAPPVLMVAGTWGWDSIFMIKNFGFKALIAVIINSTAAALIFRFELSQLTTKVSAKALNKFRASSWGVIGIHLLFLILIISTLHHAVVFMSLFILFIGLCGITRQFHEELNLGGSLLVGFFLAGVVVLGTPQQWWLEALILKLNTLQLFASATALTAITDNAALTFLGAQVEGLSESMKYALVSGAVAGGGLTVVANAPNPAGFGILKPSFGEEGISPLKLFAYAALPTLVAMICFWFIPSLKI